MAKKTLIFASLKTEDDYYPVSFAFTSWDEFHRATWNPTVDVKTVIDLSRVPGKTYAEKQSNLQDKAIEFQYADEGGLSWSEFAEVTDFFARYGKRFGLLREFRENGIC